jgi:hypothetical protein
LHPARFAPSQDDDLLSQHQDLGFQCCPRSKQIDDSPKNHSAERQHPVEDRPILRPKPIGWNSRQGQQHFGLALDAVYSVRDALSRLREVAPALVETGKFQKLLSHPSPHVADLPQVAGRRLVAQERRRRDVDLLRTTVRRPGRRDIRAGTRSTNNR